MTKHFLEGKTINGIKIAEDKLALLFDCTDGQHVARCDADCCSYTWIEAVELPAGGFPCVVTGTGDLKLPKDVENEDGLTQFYGEKITTDRGDIVIDYRNESNGYYGGSLYWPSDAFDYDQNNVSAEKWVDVQDASK